MEFRESKGSKQCDFTRWSRFAATVALALFTVGINGRRRDRSLSCPTRSLDGRSWVLQTFRCWNSELSVDDLRTWQGVVPGRAVSTLRSIETQPLAWGFVLSDRRDPETKSIGAENTQTCLLLHPHGMNYVHHCVSRCSSSKRYRGFYDIEKTNSGFFFQLLYGFTFHKSSN